MFSDYSKRRERLPAFVLLCAAVILACFLLPEELSFRAPLQEYENNDIKDSRIIFSRPPGFYDDPFTLKIKAPTREIYYTLDGTEPVRDQENTFRYEGGIEISDATSQENVHSMRTDVTPSFDADLLAEYAADYESKNYTVPDYPVDKCTILRAVFYDEDGQRSGVETASYFVGYDGREGYGKIKTVSIVTDPANRLASGVFMPLSIIRAFSVPSRTKKRTPASSILQVSASIRMISAIAHSSLLLIVYRFIFPPQKCHSVSCQPGAVMASADRGHNDILMIH